ncbi:MAG: sugar-binding domain-containing protein [Candidatus Kryptoniota bacterium]
MDEILAHSRTIVLSCIAIALSALGSVVANGQDYCYNQKTAALMTRWGKELQTDRAHVLDDYPRMQLRRMDWLNLNGIWQFEGNVSLSSPPFGQSLPQCILVPFCVESALSGIMQHYSTMWYRKIFTVPSSWVGKRILLHFGAVDWQSTVYVNGILVGVHSGGYDPFTFDITPWIKFSPDSVEIIVGVYDPTDDGGQPRGKQTLMPVGIWFSAVSGIWQTVWLEPVPTTYIDNISVTPDIDNDQVYLQATLVGKDSLSCQVKFIAKSNGVVVGGGWSYGGSRVAIRIDNPVLWQPSNPFIYDLRIYLLSANGTVTDSVDSYFAMRKVGIFKDALGRAKITLNNKFVFQVGVLDQGYWPDGLYTPPSDSALQSDILNVKKMGFNLIRKHMKIEPDRWYYWCDKIGILVWQDMPSGNNTKPTDKVEFTQELGRIVNSLYNHPSIIMWVIFNEGWGQFDTQNIVDMIKRQDQSRLIDAASGWVDVGAGDIVDLHGYPGPPLSIPTSGRAAVVGEYGGGWLEIQGHMWGKYDGKGLSSANALANFYINGAQALAAMRDTAGLSGAVYTELTDVETEYAGLMTYDRDVLKCYYFAIYSANLSLLTGINDNKHGPLLRKVNGGNYPNPFNESTVIHFTISEPGPVYITIFDISGRIVRKMVDGVMPRGDYSITWDGKGSDGATLPSGLYICRMSVGGRSSIVKMVLLK